MTCMVSFRPEQRTGPIFKFFRCSNYFIAQKVYFAVNASLGWLNNVSCFFVFPANHKWSISVH